MITETLKILSDVDGAIAGFNKVETKANAFRDRMRGIGGTIADFGTKMESFTAPLKHGLEDAAHEAIEFNDVIGKTSRALGMSEEFTQKFNDEVLKIAPSIGMAPEKFAELAQEAGKLGVKEDKIVEFGTVVGKMGAIANLTERQMGDLTKSFAALSTITGASAPQLEKYGAAVNKLDDSIGGTVPTTVEFTRQTAAAGKLLNINMQQLAGYGATMASLGIQNGVAYRSFNSLLTKLAAPQTMSKKGQQALAELGLSSTQLADAMKKDANQGIDMFLKKLNALAHTDVSKALGVVKETIGADYGSTILTLAASTDKLHTALKVAVDDQGNMAKSTMEMNKRMASFKGQQAAAEAQMQSMAIMVGQAVLPALNALMGMTTPLIGAFVEFAQTHPGIMKVAVSIAAIATFGAPVVVFLGSLISAIGTVTALFGGISLAVAAPIAALIALGAATGYLIANWDHIVPAITNALSAALRAIANFGSFMWNAGSAFIGNFFNGMFAMFGKGLEWFKGMLANLRALLPGSEPKIKSPLSNLASAGAATMENFASGFGTSKATTALSGAIGEARSQLTAPVAAASNGGGNISINDNRTININAGQGGQQSWILDQLRKSDRELLDLIDKAVARWRRGS